MVVVSDQLRLITLYVCEDYHHEMLSRGLKDLALLYIVFDEFILDSDLLFL